MKRKFLYCILIVISVVCLCFCIAASCGGNTPDQSMVSTEAEQSSTDDTSSDSESSSPDDTSDGSEQSSTDDTSDDDEQQPQIETAEITCITNAVISGNDIYLLVEYTVNSISLSGQVICTENCGWKLYGRNGITEIPTKVITSLDDGNNTYYIVVTSVKDSTISTTYTLTIYKSFAVTVNYYNGDEKLFSETAYSGYTYSAEYIPEITDYTFNYWETDEGQEYSAITLFDDLELYANLTADHNYSSEWSYDGTAHWHACINDDCDKIKDYEEHTPDGDGVNIDNYTYYTCEVCGAEYSVYEHITHTYGEGIVGVPYPTATSTGGAMFICTTCGHVEEVVLPALTDSGYTSLVTQKPTASEDGTSVYTYHTEYGVISFEVTISSNGILSVSDAVSISTSEENHNMVRSVTGTRGDKKVESGEITSDVLAELEESVKTFSYELYDGYTHIIADDTSEYWISCDGSEVYGYVEDEMGNFSVVSNSNYLMGFRYYEVYTDSLGYAYGTENFLATLYEYAKTNVNGDFTESVATTAGKTTYTFSFGTYMLYYNGLKSGLFSVITVSFTLSSSYTIETFEYYSVTYANDSSAYDTETGGWTSEAAFDIDENGYACVTNYSGLKYIETYSVTQTLRVAGESEESNPYTAETRYYSDFDVTYNGEIIDKNTEIEIFAGSNSGYVFAVENFTPVGIIGDTITFYYREYEEDGNYTDTEINYGTISSAGIMVYLESETNKFCIKSSLTGEINIVVKSEYVAKEFTINFYTVPPTAFYSTVYDYDSSTGYANNTSEDNTAAATVYIGQPLYFKASLSEDEQGVKTETYIVAVTGDNITPSDYLITEMCSLMVLTSDFETVSEFVACKAGTYTLTLMSTEDETVICTITVTVIQHDINSILSGTYSATFDSGNIVTVTFGDITENKVTVSTEGSSISEYYECTVTATIAYGEYINLPLIITYNYYISDGTMYMLDISDMSTITVTDNMLDSIMGNDLEDSDQIPAEAIFRIVFNEAYDLVISHAIGSAGASESVILTLQE